MMYRRPSVLASALAVAMLLLLSASAARASPALLSLRTQGGCDAASNARVRAAPCWARLSSASTSFPLPSSLDPMAAPATRGLTVLALQHSSSPPSTTLIGAVTLDTSSATLASGMAFTAAWNATCARAVALITNATTQSFAAASLVAFVYEDGAAAMPPSLVAALQAAGSRAIAALSYRAPFVFLRTASSAAAQLPQLDQVGRGNACASLSVSADVSANATSSSSSSSLVFGGAWGAAVAALTIVDASTNASLSASTTISAAANAPLPVALRILVRDANGAPLGAGVDAANGMVVRALVTRVNNVSTRVDAGAAVVSSASLAASAALFPALALPASLLPGPEIALQFELDSVDGLFAVSAPLTIALRACGAGQQTLPSGQCAACAGSTYNAGLSASSLAVCSACPPFAVSSADGKFCTCSSDGDPILGADLFDADFCVKQMRASETYTMLPLSVLFVLLAATTLALVYRWRLTRTLFASSPTFCALIAAGSVLVSSSCLLMYVPRTPALCALDLWLFNLGFTIGFGALFLKTYRIARLFNNKTLTTIKIQDSDLLRYLGAFVAIDCLLLGLATGLAPPSVSPASKIACVAAPSGQAVLAALLISKSLLTAWGTYLAYQVRNAQDLYNESRQLAATIYNLLVMNVFYWVFAFFFGKYISTKGLIRVEWVVKQWVVLASLASILFVKFWHILAASTGRQGDSLVSSQSSGDANSKGGGSGGTGQKYRFKLDDIDAPAEELRQKLGDVCKKREQTKQKSITAENQLAARLKAAQDTQRALDEAERDIHLLDAEQEYLQSLLLLKEDEGMVQLVRAASLTARQSLLMLTRLPSTGGGNSPASTESSDAQQQRQQPSPVPEANSSIDLDALAPAPSSSAALAMTSDSTDN